MTFGSAAALVIAGLVCLAAIGGETGQILALVLIGLGLVLATSLVFLEVGLSEDRELARQQRRRPGPRIGRRSRRGALERPRSHRRRLG